MSEILDGQRLVVDRWPSSPDGWVELIESANIPPSIVRRGIAFDGASAPSVVEVDGLMVLRDLGCPDCGIPVTVVYRSWPNEPRQMIEDTARGGLVALDWHSRHR